MNVTEAIAEAVAREGTTALYGLMGDGNMELMERLAVGSNVRVVQARHENAAVAMADGHARVTGDVGVCSVTCGPGVTQIPTSLTASVRHGTSMVVLAGDTPLADAFNLQEFNLAPLVAATGAGYRALADADSAVDEVHRTFLQARMERRPVVLGLPIDLQAEDFPWGIDAPTSADLQPPAASGLPAPDAVNRLVEALRTSERPILLAGAGAVASGAIDVLRRLGEATGSLLATTLRAKGAFADDPFSAGIAGAFATEVARALFVEADLVVGFGAAMGHFTTEGGYLFPTARVVQVDLAPRGLHEGLRVADDHVVGDARTVAEQVLSQLHDRRLGYRRDDVRARLPAPPVNVEPHVDLESGAVDPREVMRSLTDVLPKDAFVVVGAGHFWHFPVQYLQGGGRWEFTYDFGVVGQGLPTALGIAVAQDRPVVLIEGDGSLLMNIQELETAHRHGLRVLVVAMNDGAYGAEVHKLSAKGRDGSTAVFGRPDLAGLAQAFGLRGHHLFEAGDMHDIVVEHLAGDTTTVVDVPMSSRVLSPQYRRLYLGLS